MEIPESVIYLGRRYTIQTNGRYYQGPKRNGTRLLHRHVWADNFGEIPKDHDIHHKDDCWWHNEPDNLEPICLHQHRREHAKERVRLGTLKPPTEKALRQAAKWHGSEEGSDWHSKHAKEQWKNATTKTKQCENCGEDYETYMGDSKYCSRACTQHVNFQTYFTDKRKCAWCSKEFVANRHRDTKCCSRTCSNRLRGEQEKIFRPERCCAFCNKLFQPTTKHANNQCCSRGCSARKRASDNRLQSNTGKT